jgi:arylsulfatase A-like enzyme/tetratricopeptide (TPR) repeat protein
MRGCRSRSSDRSSPRLETSTVGVSHRKLSGLGIAVLAVAVLISCAGEESLPTGDRRLNVLVITLDTIRADRLGAYGNPDIRTDFVDGLAKRGVLFDRCIAPTPLTLPSHTSLFTGTYPIFHGVRDNGNYVVPADLTTMAELFNESGYRTGGFVGAFVLSSRWGLDQGFETYTEPKGAYDPALVSFAQIQRRGDEVVDDAISWLRKESEKPWFAWVHLYDPHLPYDPPPAFAGEYPGDPYLGEVAYADAELSRLHSFLKSSGLDSRTLIVFAGDHGEGLGDHGEHDHGLLLYQTTSRAPLIITHPNSPSNVRRGEVVSLIDILPTVVEATGLSLPGDVQGQSLWPLIGGDGAFDERPVYAETHYPKLHFGWSPLTALQNRQFQLIQSSDPELYDLENDPRQEKNVFGTNTSVADKMTGELEELILQLGQGAMDATSAPDADTVAKLAALGYVAGGVETTEGQAVDDLPSPRSMLWLYNLLIAANNLVAAGDEAGGERKLLELLEANDSLVDGWVSLGKLYRNQGRMAEALVAFREASARRPQDPFLVSRLANALISAQQPAEAEQHLLVAQAKHPDNPLIVFAMARVMESSGRFEEAEILFRKTLTLDPLSAPAHVRLAALALRRADPDTAAAQLEAAQQIDPQVAEAHLIKGQLLEGQNLVDEAARAYRTELGYSPNSIPAAIALSRLEGRRGRPAEQEKVLRNAIQTNPQSPGPYLLLAMTFLQREERYAEAVELAQLALERGPKGRELQLNYFLLADLYNRLGDSAQEHKYAELGRSMTAGGGEDR